MLDRLGSHLGAGPGSVDGRNGALTSVARGAQVCDLNQQSSSSGDNSPSSDGSECMPQKRSSSRMRHRENRTNSESGNRGRSKVRSSTSNRKHDHSTQQEGPLIASFNAQGEDQAELHRRSAESEEVLIGAHGSTDNSAAPIPMIKQVADHSGSNASENPVPAKGPLKFKGQLLGPMEPMEPMKTRNQYAYPAKSNNRYSGPSFPGVQDDVHDFVSPSSLTSPAYATNRAIISYPRERAPVEEGHKSLPSLSEDSRLANAMAADCQSNTGDEPIPIGYRTDRPNEYLNNMLADMYAQSASPPSLAFQNANSRNRVQSDGSLGNYNKRLSQDVTFEALQRSCGPPQSPGLPASWLPWPIAQNQPRQPAVAAKYQPLDSPPRPLSTQPKPSGKQQAGSHVHNGQAANRQYDANDSNSRFGGWMPSAPRSNASGLAIHEAGRDHVAPNNVPQDKCTRGNEGHSASNPAPGSNSAGHLDSGRGFAVTPESSSYSRIISLHPGHSGEILPQGATPANGWPQAVTTTAYPILISAPTSGPPSVPPMFQVPTASTPPAAATIAPAHPSNDAGLVYNPPPLQTEDRVYKCSFPGCEWSFARSSDHKRHVRSHQKPSLRCPFWELEANCNRKGGMFYRLDVLKRHLRLVHLNRPVDGSKEGGHCRVCNQKFEYTRDFIEHCDECAKRALAARTTCHDSCHGH